MNFGAFGENFPYSNFHDLNMDWILKIVKDFEDHYTSIHETIEAGIALINEKTDEAIIDALSQINNQLDADLLSMQTAYNEYITNINTTASTKENEVLAYMNQKLIETTNSIDDFITQVTASIPQD